jgi:23S rRNA (pseudouridine1915-N3)-methyltransferase
MQVRIISVGKRQPAALRGIEQGYEKRMRQTLPLEWHYVSPSAITEASVAVRKESEQILRLLSPDVFVVLLDERGQQLTSPDLALQLDTWLTGVKELIFIIGGAYGVDKTVRQRADLVWSLSALVLPHELVRTLLTEQLYRACTIRAGIPYHHAETFH